MAEDSKENDDENVKLVIYDFDQTITYQHLYGVLSDRGYKSSADKYLKQDMGHLQHSELKKMTDDDLIKVYGGKDRLKRVNEHFNALKTNGITLAIISFGYVHIIKEALKRMNLFDAYFKNAVIIGNDSKELNDAFGSKGQTIKNLFGNMNPSQVLFVDDDEDNTEEAEEMKVCKTLTIEPRNGMSEAHMKQIEDLCINGIQIKKSKAKDNKSKEDEWDFSTK